MKPRIFQTFLLSLLALNCDLGQSPPQESPPQASQTPVIEGHVSSASFYPLYPLHYAEVSISWNSGTLSTLADTLGGFAFQHLPHALFYLTVTARDHDTLNQIIDLTSSDSSSVAVTLTMQKGFFPGQIVLGLQDTLSLRTFVEFTTSKGLAIKHTADFLFLTDSLSLDSAQKVQDFLVGKSYLSSGSFYTENGRLAVWYFVNLTSDLLLDWEATSQQLGIREVPSEGWSKHALLLVPPGTENQWIQQLSGEPIITYLSLNLIVAVASPLPPNKRLHPTEVAGG
jgi:hypothetical protein